MKSFKLDRAQGVLLVGDVLVLALVTLSGFARHDTLTTAGSRMLTTFLPLVLSWLLVAPFLGAYDPARAENPHELWRPFWAMVLAGPLAAFFRALLLGTPILPIFVIVIGGVSALALLAWRLGYSLVVSRRKAVDG